MARRGRKCVVDGCGRVAAVGSVVCAEHRDTALGEQTDREIMKMTQRLEAMARYEEGEEKREAMRQFRRQVMRGDYAALFSSEMVRALAEEGKGYGLREEIGMMRVAMMRLMLEEENPSRMAHGMAKLSGSLGKAMERQEAWERAEQQRVQYRAHQEARRAAAEAAIERSGREDAGATREATAAEARIEQLKDAVGKPESQESIEFKDSDWPRVGYPDYYVDVEDVKDTRWGSGSEGARIARGEGGTSRGSAR